VYIAHRKGRKVGYELLFIDGDEKFFIPERKAEIDNAVIQRAGKIRATGLSIVSSSSRAVLTRVWAELSGI